MAPGMCCMHRCPLLVLQHALCCNAASHLGCVRVPICATMASHASAAPSYWLALPGHPSTFRGAPAQQPTAASGEAASARAAPRLTAELCGRRGLGDLQQHGMAWHPQPQTHTHRGASTRTARTEASAAEAARPTAPSLCVYGGGGGGARSAIDGFMRNGPPIVADPACMHCTVRRVARGLVQCRGAQPSLHDCMHDHTAHGSGQAGRLQPGKRPHHGMAWHGS